MHVYNQPINTLVSPYSHSRVLKGVCVVRSFAKLFLFNCVASLEVWVHEIRYLPHVTSHEFGEVMYLHARDIDFASFYDFLLNFLTVPTVLYVWTVPTVLYNCSDSVVCLNCSDSVV
jgi:hypothetical protein